MKDAGKFLALGLVPGILGGGQPKPKPPPLMPDPNDPQLLNAQRQKIAQQAASAGGRASTILSQPTGDYSRTTF